MIMHSLCITLLINQREPYLVEGVYSFEPISPFSRTLTVTFNEWLDNGESASYPISFKFDASKAKQ
ncbi:hypothetical protein SAMN05518848_102779 [Paenibacillus sp. PDC88]|nr:hypothetical protein SAMN05518848_102779 [Paenibacillus sp. PDC88]